MVEMRMHNENWRYLRNGSSYPLHVWFYGGVFRVGRSNGVISNIMKSNMASGRHVGKFRVVISQTQVIWLTSCLVLGKGFRIGRINGAIYPVRSQSFYGSCQNFPWHKVDSMLTYMLHPVLYMHFKVQCLGASTGGGHSYSLRAI